MPSALLFERNTVEEIRTWDEKLPRIGRSSVLWIDLDDPDREVLLRLGERLDLDDGTVRELTERDDSGPRFTGGEQYVHVTAVAPAEGRELTRVDCLVAARWIVTVRERRLNVLETFRERASSSGETGRLDGPEFLADLLEWIVEAYFDAFEQIEVDLEEVDTLTMSGELRDRDAALTRLVEIRREIGRLRRALTSHREAILALSRPELEAISSSSSAERFTRLRDRLEEAAQAARDSRESVVGSFDVLVATTGQRTNEIMKILTLASVLLLPGALIAGIMGMNFRVGLFEHTGVFWIVIVAIAGIGAATLAVARVRDWI